MAHRSPTLTAIGQAEAARAFVGLVDPEGIATPASAAKSGECFRLEAETGALRYAVSFGHGAAWITGAAGQGQGMTAEGLRMIEAQALARGCRRVGFQTVRRGLVRRAIRQGYRITSETGAGFVLVKDIP